MGRECLAVIWAMGQFEPYLIDAPFTVVTDHAALQWLPTKKMGNSRLQRWAMALMEFKYSVIHRAGKNSVNVDSLSRAPIAGSAPMDESVDPPIAPGEREPHFVRIMHIHSKRSFMWHYVQTCDLPSITFPVVGHSAPIVVAHTGHRMHPDRHAMRVSASAAATPSSSSTYPSASSRGAPHPQNRPAPRAPPSVADAEEAKQALQAIAKAPNPGVSIIDLSQLDHVINEQYKDPHLAVIIRYQQDRLVPAELAEAAKKRLVSTGYNFVLLPQAPPLRPALFYFPARPKRGLSSLVPLVPRVVVPKSMHREIIELFHRYAFAGHFGERRTVRKIMVNYYWETLLPDVIAYVNACEACQLNKIQRQRPERPMGLITHPTHAFELMSMDFVGPFTPPSEGFPYILVLCDHFTRWVITVPCVDQKAETVARALVDHVYSHYGMPTRLLSDRGTSFHGELVRELNSYLRVKMLFTSAHHPQTNGLVERFNATLKDMLATLGDEFKNGSWNLALQPCTFAYNTSVHEATGMTPYYALYGREATTPGDAIAITAAENEYDKDIPYLQYNKTAVDHIHRAQEYLRSLQAVQRLERDAANDKIVRVTTYAVGDLVLCRDPRSDTSTGAGRARVVPFQGPYLIVRMNGNRSYALELISDRSIKTVANIDRLKPYHSMTKLDEQYLTTASSPMPAVASGHFDDDDIAMQPRTRSPSPETIDADEVMDTTSASSRPSADHAFHRSKVSSTPFRHFAPKQPPRSSFPSSSTDTPAGAAHARHSGKSTPLYSDHAYGRLLGTLSQSEAIIPTVDKAKQIARRTRGIANLAKLHSPEQQEIRRLRKIEASGFINIHTDRKVRSWHVDAYSYPPPPRPTRIPSAWSKEQAAKRLAAASIDSSSPSSSSSSSPLPPPAHASMD